MQYARRHSAHSRWSARSKMRFTSCSSAWKSYRCDIRSADSWNATCQKSEFMGVCCMQLLRANGACERTATPASCRTAWSCNSHQAPEDSQYQIGDGAGSVTVRELADKIQQAEQLLLARLENIAASIITCKSRGHHAGRRTGAGSLNNVGTLLAAFERLHNRVEVRSDASRAVAVDAMQGLYAVECLTQVIEGPPRQAAGSQARGGAGEPACGVACLMRRRSLGQDSDESDTPASEASSAESGSIAGDSQQREAMQCTDVQGGVIVRRERASPSCAQAPWWPPSAPGG